MPAPWFLARRIARMVADRGYCHRDGVADALGAQIPEKTLHQAIGLALARQMVDRCDSYLVPPSRIH